MGILTCLPHSLISIGKPSHFSIHKFITAYACSTHPWLHFSLRIKLNLLQRPSERPAESPSSDPFYLLLLSMGSTLGSLHFFLLDTSASGPLHWCSLFQRKLLIRYYLGPLPHFLHTFDQCNHLRGNITHLPFSVWSVSVVFYHMTYFFTCLFSVGLK